MKIIKTKIQLTPSTYLLRELFLTHTRSINDNAKEDDIRTKNGRPKNNA